MDYLEGYFEWPLCTGGISGTKDICHNSLILVTEWSLVQGLTSLIALFRVYNLILEPFVVLFIIPPVIYQEKFIC